MSDDEKDVETHPSFGMIGFHRVTGGRGALFGSHIEKHHETIVMRVKGAERSHHLNHDWYRGRDLLIDVEMSPAQFAQLLTTMNVGDGVPCTVRFVEGRGKIEHMPEGYVPEQVKILEGVKKCSADMMASIKDSRYRIREILDQKKINKNDKKEILELSEAIFKWAEDNMPFAFESFEESAEKVVTAAKSQVDSFVLNVLTKVGLEHLKERFSLQSNVSPLLESSPDEKKLGV